MNNFNILYKIKTVRFFGLFLIFLFLRTTDFFAATITSKSTGGPWATGGTWVGNNVPAVGDNVIIATTGGSTVNIAATITQTAAGSVTINNGAILTTSGGTITFGALTLNTGSTFTLRRALTVLGATNISGTISFGSTSGTTRAIAFNGPVTLNTGAVWSETTTGAASTFTFANSFSNSATTFTSQATTHSFSGAGMTFSGTTATSIPTVTITGSYTNNGILTASTSLTGTGSLINGATGTLNIGAAENITTLTTSAVGNTVNYYGAAQTVNPGTFSNLTLSGTNAKTLTGVTAVGANLVLSGTATATTASNMTVGALQIGTGTTLTTGNNLTLAVSGTTNITGSLVLGGTGAKTFTGDVTLNSGGVWNETGIATLNFGGSITNNATTFTANTGIHNFTGVSKTLTGSLTTSIPTVNITGSYTNNGIFSATTALNGIGGSLINEATGTLNIGGTSLITTLTTSAVGNTVNYNGAVQTVRSQNYSNLTLSGSGIKTLLTGTTNIGSNLTLSGTASAIAAVGLTIGSNVIIGTGSTFNGSTFTHTIAGNWTNNGGTFTPATSTISLTGVASQIGGTFSPQNFYNLTVGSGTTTIATVATTSNILTVNTGTNLIISGANSLTPTSAIINGTVTVTETGSLVKGTGVIQFNSGSTYNHNRDGGAIPISTWDVNSTCLVSGVTITVPTVATFSQTFGNFTWDCTTQTGNISLSGFLTDINGNLSVLSTNSGSLRLINAGANRSLIVDGNYIQSGGNFFVFGDVDSPGNQSLLNIMGDFSLSNGIFNLTGSSATGVLNVANNFTFSNGTITKSGTGTANLNFNGTTSQTYLKSGGVFSSTIDFGVGTSSIVDFGTSVIDGSGGTFNLLGNGTVLTKNTGGFALAGATGTVQVLGTRNYSATANYIYNGDLAQSIGTGVVTANDITINNTLGATLSTSTTINNLLSLTSGRLTLGANNLTFGTNALPVAGSLNASNMIDAGSTGQVRKLISSNGAYTLPIGEIDGTPAAADYSPITINFTGGTYAGGAYVAANVTNAKHPNNNYTKYYLNRYFTVASSGITAFTANLEAQFLDTDTVGLASNQITARYASGVWTNFSLLTNNLLKANGLTSFGDFTGISNLPEISTSTNSLSGFTYQKNAGPSTSIQNFTVTGTKLTDNVIITPPASFEVSELGGINFIARSFVTLFPTSGNVNQAVYVRMKAGLNEGAVPSENIEVSTNGAIETLNVACSGNVTTQATIIVSPVSILDYTATFKGTASAARNFTVSGTFLLGNITLEAPTGYEMKISTQSTYVSSLPVPVTPPTLANTTINVRLKSGLGVGTYNGNIVASSSTADNKTVALTGVVNPVATLTTSTSWLASFIYTLGNTNPPYQTFYLNGTNLSANASLSVPTTPQQQFQLSTNGTTWASSVSVAHTAGTISNVLVYARLNTGLSVGSYGPTNVTISSGVAVVKTVALSGQVVNSPTIIISKNSLTGFGYLFGSSLTTSQSITVSGASLTGNITVNCPANYEISTNNVSFDSIAINLSPLSDIVAPQQIFYRLKLNRPSGIYETTASITATGATTRTLSLFGKVFASPLISSTGGGEYCLGETINLTSSGQDVQSQFWTGPSNYYSSLPNPTLTNATTQMSGNYTVTGNVIVGGNLIVNGDFEMDNAGFSSSYGYVAPTANALYPEGLYTVTNLASNVHGNFNSMPDKNVIGTKQMIINGNVTAGAVVWTQSVPVVPSSQYEFTYWLQTVVNGTDVAPSKLQLYVNGEIAGPVYTANPTSGIWTQYIYNTSSASNTILNLELINQTTAASGNDFALDSISFKQILSATSTQNVNVSASVVASVTVTHSPTNTYQSSPVVFTANPVNGGTAPTYKWYVGGVVQDGETAQTFSYTPTALGSVTITCEMTSSIKCAAPKPASGSDPINVVAQPPNYWMGYIDTDWGKEGNWTANIIPATGDNVIYATVDNFGVAAIKDLHLDKNRTIGSLINATFRRLVIPANLTLICNNTISVTPPVTDPITNKQDLIYIYASTTLPNGSIKYNNPINNPAFGTIEMYSPASWNKDGGFNNVYQWQFFGIPVTSVVANPTFYGAYVRELFESDKDTATHWRSLKNESVLQPFIGYELCQQNPKFYTFKGQMVNSNYSSGRFIKTTDALYPGQHLFANPYTAALDIRQIEFGAGVEATAYLYATGTFLAWRNLKNSGQQGLGAVPGQYFAVPKNQAGTPGIPRQVPSMGTLMVRIPPGAQSNELSYVSFNYSTVTMGNSERQRAKAASTTDNQATTTIEIEGENGADKLWIMSHESYTRGFDNGFDGKKLIGNALNPQLYAVENDGKYQINSVDDINNTTLAFQAGQDTEYKLTFTHDENAQLKYKKVYLHDLVENKITDISLSGTSYNFTATSTTKPVIRFKVLSQSASEDIAKTSNTKVYHFDNQLFVQNFSEFGGKVYVYDISGRTVGIKSISANQNIQIAAPRNNTYIVKIVVGSITETTKIFLQ